MYSLALGAHLVTLAVTIPLILATDHYALSWVRGKRAVLDKHILTRLHHIVGSGLLLMIASGAYMLSGQWEYLLTEPTFLFKLAFVGLLIGNSFAIGASVRVATERPYATLSNRERFRVLLPGALSLLGWIGAITAAVLTFSY